MALFHTPYTPHALPLPDIPCSSYLPFNAPLWPITAFMPAPSLLCDQVVGCELEGGAEMEDAIALKGDFPFQGIGPPRVQHTSHSPGLHRLLEAIEDSQGKLSTAEHTSLVKVGGGDSCMVCDSSLQV